MSLFLGESMTTKPAVKRWLQTIGEYLAVKRAMAIPSIYMKAVAMHATLSTKRRNLFIILILGALDTITPMAIDMYLPAFPQIAQGLNTSVAQVSLSLSSYFIGFAIGQLFYGPLLDRFGRKHPLYIGLGIFIVASLGCLAAGTVEQLVALRFLQALGGCAAAVAAMAMVRDFFAPEESARIFSLLMLILGVSPLLAPTIGSFITVTFGWHAVFIVLAALTIAVLAVVYWFLPEAHVPDRSISMHPLRIAQAFKHVITQPQFYTYAFAGSFSFAGLLVYVAGSPLIFMNHFHVDAQTYGIIFAVLAAGFIGSNQVNILLLKRYRSEQIFKYGLLAQTAIGAAFLATALTVGTGDRFR